ncbi:hypothetical protein HZH68_007204 [Vespula germanica]|uniref:Uncharacterized protein n=2 Tax=Vespula TaxID=7451 RepID=A0A834KAL5_VESGE|nr:hypothetical protein HZH68_007204 [Vespula germanica]
MDEPEREGEKEKLEGGRTSTTICDRSENDPQRCHVSENQDSALNIESFGGCENRWTMSTGPTWGSRLFLAFATTTIVITNYQCHCERTHLREKLVNGYRMMRNITGLQGYSKPREFLASNGVGIREGLCNCLAKNSYQ